MTRPSRSPFATQPRQLHQYEGDADFLAGPTERTRAVQEMTGELFPEERRRAGAAS
ncbi:hypothetical protein GCM10011579_001370 [Streptomyces albiflavescens]|uniref:Uncharacterized protein n=1 Tax=Streptomyces albiflavescens TaxID=1623582 RepID=A0A917XQ42_9ACTN|nr:hypothetical protein [Streptomyces albiflavescens]GGN48594.1 hypothetical protein GCM10011579_001370 [Streptomyces albiflavescens]